ncbi:MAG: DUF881 domain-containing protein [Mycobacteriales bacterium]
MTDEGLTPPERDHRPAWHVFVPVTALLAGLLFATSAATSQGNDLRAGRRTQLTELISNQARQVAKQEQAASDLRAAVAQAQARTAVRNGAVAAEQARGESVQAYAGLTAVRGPGLIVSLDDAPRQSGDAPMVANPDDLVVHQQDVQAVVNALWAGGAEAMTLMGQRLISTSAVRCVGNTVILQGRVYSPPFVVQAIGATASLRTALDEEPGVQIFRSYVDRYGLGYSVRTKRDLALPAYDGLLELQHVAPAR